MNNVKQKSAFTISIGYSLLSRRVRKYFLSIITVFCFLISVGNGSYKVPSAVAGRIAAQSQYSITSPNYPDIELEIAHPVIFANGNCRQQGQQNFASTLELAASDFYSRSQQQSECLSASPSKQYLSHIYPSHNFW